MIYLTECGGFSRSKKESGVNQDSWLLPRRFGNGYIMAVADGVGSYTGSEIASSIVTEFIANHDFADCIDVKAIIDGARNAVIEAGIKDSKISNAATTLTFCYISSHEIRIGHIGDCRAYILERGRLVQLTTDHTQHQKLFDEGIYTKKELKSHSGQSNLISAISKNIEPKYQEVIVPLSDISTDDGKIRLFIMSDGAHRFWSVRPRLAISTLASPTRFAFSLKNRINRMGPNDDNTLIGAEFSITSIHSQNELFK
ncbi:PP2C family protein-serine/threonine phosphatase [Xanthomonas campestris]|uniref:PP2C family protein-serine/threonine phosphatase n=1 Tax=Xanthomonas campestris TaxID=339 RepID=UPI001CD6EA12|nr:protein phosphatase 2C domain-containing protein [Xanthomonas campestris]MEA9783860.1 protein phosphatase 2C domain-containing protein [Xanthomonas campestris pv. raphani]MEA9792138.1 protein phosphatase 2C domain-containing protein [Xanthomonas campestris pv. raphani]MEA9803754.1 protein phosphatase 2C domain-containing protein [Xanthomonas campestris pv. raphani]MEA9820215.1 protein phosphatase 2C domain-containing protein [Xanthomonas campestris pv. raphani]MEA9873245.1 protein phosphata